MSALARAQSGDLTIQDAPPGARELGIRNLPSLRLAIGFRDLNKRGAPTKVDHFIAKDGQEGEFARQAAKFRQVYGEKPKFCNIRLMGSLEQSLDISYKAFRGGGDPEGDGGVMVAKGASNYAVLPWTGGADMLTVWNQDGSVDQVETAGLDAITGEPLDALAKDLGLALYTTFRFGLPEVLGYGSFCEITSKGKATTDMLWTKLHGWYGTFGTQTPWVMRPMLVVRPARARPVVQKRGEPPKRIKTRIWVLDLLIPETEDAMLERLRDFRQLTSNSVDDLFGTAASRALPAAQGDATEASGRQARSQAPPAPTSPAGDHPEGGPEPDLLSETPPSGQSSSAGSDESVRERTEADDGGAQPGPSDSAAAPLHIDGDPGPALPEPDWTLEPEIEGVEPTPVSAQPVEEVVEDAEFEDLLTPAEQAALPTALAFKVPGGSFQGRTIKFLVEQGDKAEPWILYALAQPWPQDPGFRDALLLAVKANRRETFDAYTKGGAA
jgi:hypothetical protein